MPKIILLQHFCPLKAENAGFPIGLRLNTFTLSYLLQSGVREVEEAWRRVWALHLTACPTICIVRITNGNVHVSTLFQIF